MSRILPPIEAFIDSQRIDRGASDKTIEAYRRDLLQFAEFLHGLAPELTLEAIEAAHLRDFLETLHRLRQKPASIARKSSSLRQFFKFCCLERGLRDNPAEGIQNPRPGRRLPRS